MITLNNSNIDFDFEDESLGSKYSISLSRNTSNFVFTTDGNERMTIRKNGKVGIGTVGSDYDLDVNGSINATVYLINGIDISTSAITGDTSNYVTSTSNLLIDRIRDTSNYVKDTSNVLVGRINHTSNYVRDTSNILEDLFKLISNNYVITSSGNPISGIIENCKYMIFTYTTDTVSGSGQTRYDINVTGPETGLIGDILMVGGGGAGGEDLGGGGGGGAVLYGSNINIPLGPSTIYVGRGAIPGEAQGKSTQGFYATVLGGGSAANFPFINTQENINTLGNSINANSGGGGAGGKTYTLIPFITSQYLSGGNVIQSSKGNLLTTATLHNGYNGETAFSTDLIVECGGGGGAGSAGNNGNGGAGVLVNILGVDYYWGGGGGGGNITLSSSDTTSLANNGGIGGGGPGQKNTENTYTYGNSGTNSYGTAINNNGREHTGGGGGGGSTNKLGGNGGSGIIIIKYFPSSYVEKTDNILIGRINNTSNYIRDTSNILAGRISNTSNYVGITCNILIGRINNTSNYICDTSNILAGRISNTNNYVWITSNILVGRINDTSNYVWNTSNILAGRISDTSNYIGITSDILVGNIVNTSNYVNDTSNILARRISDTSNYVRDTCNILIGPINGMSNYVNDTCNILIGRITDTSNYIRDTYNILAGCINNTSNLVKDTSNILVGNINNNSNYIEITRNKLTSFVNSELSSKSQWKYNNNNIYYDVGNVGIGTANPVSKLNIYSQTIPNTITLENKQSPFFDISPNTGYTETTTIEYGMNYKNIIFNAYSSNYPRIYNNVYSPYYAENPSGATLLAWYKFDGDGNDSSPNNKHLSVINNGTPTYSNDLFQGRRYVNTGTGSFKCNGFPFNGNVSFSISVWIKNPISGSSMFYIHQGSLNNNTANKQLIIGVRHNTNSYYMMSYYQNEVPPYVQLTPTTYSNSTDYNNWVHIVYVVSYSASIYKRQIYRNGILSSEDTPAEKLNIDSDAYNMYIGSSYITSSSSESTLLNQNINISDLRIYSNALTQSQVLQLYNNNIINFKIPMPIRVNGSLNNVSIGRYMITTSPTNNITPIMRPLDGQSALFLPSGTSTTVTIKYDMAIGEISGDPPTMIGTTGEYKYLIYTYTKDTIIDSGQTTYNITVPYGGITCDILMVGGGGAGGSYIGPNAEVGYAYSGGGGGGGAVFFGKNVKINEGSYDISIGRGGRGGIFDDSSGKSTVGFGYTIRGGQSANYVNDAVNNGASGAGSPIILSVPYSGLNVNGGNAGTNEYPSANLFIGNRGGKSTEFVSGRQSYQAGGGGGAGTPAKPSYYNSGGAEADGGDGVLVDILGIDLYWGGGGGGSGYNAVSGKGGLGGGGCGGGNIIETPGTYYEGQNSFCRPSKPTQLDAGPHTGGGGGGAAINDLNTIGNGGSGIIIIKYLSSSSTSDIELINGVTSDNIIDYKIGNYNNIFKITSFKNGINTDNLVIDSNGNVGIGTLPPSYRLEVSECLATEKRGALDLLIATKYLGRSNNINNTTFNKFSIINICARFNGSIWITGECLFALNSDIRIKEDIQDINDDSALQMILAIEPKTYTYIDKIENGNNKVYGFIAQRVQKVIPEAVSIDNAYIPNIMMLADYYSNIITLPYKSAKVAIKIKDKIKCYDSNNNSIEVEVIEIIDEISFKIKDLDKKYKNNKIFVYGTNVDDFHILSKEYIYTLNVGATQELYKQIKEHDNIIKSREEEINELEKQNKDLNEKYEMLLKVLTLIKH